MLWMGFKSVLIIEAEVLHEDELSKVLGLFSFPLRAKSALTEAHFLILTPDIATENCSYVFEGQESVVRFQKC